ncbi:hypothetical protein D4768_27190 [Rhodococcus erythropolis]|nr:hypothetical protein D4768_27190 [Rhodococcus erythropolis]
MVLGERAGGLEIRPGDMARGIGRPGTPGCNIVIWDNQLLPFSVVDLLGDAAAQIGNEAGASIRDAGR